MDYGPETLIRYLPFSYINKRSNTQHIKSYNNTLYYIAMLMSFMFWNNFVVVPLTRVRLLCLQKMFL